VFLLSLAFSVSAQEVSQYYTKYDLLSAPPSAFQDGLLGFANPAIPGMLHAPEMRFYWADGANAFSMQDWGLFTAGANSAFAMQQRTIDAKKVTDFSIALGAGFDSWSFGLAYDWSKGDVDHFNRQRQVKFGAIFRPDQRLSFGVTSYWGLESRDFEGVLAFGLRPFATPVLTLFGDAIVSDKHGIGDQWSVGAAWRVFPGIHTVYRQFGTDAFTVGLALDIGHVSFAAQQRQTGGASSNSYMLRSGGFKNNIFQKALNKVFYTPLKLSGTVQYQKYKLFDAHTLRFYDLLRDIRAAANDPRIAALAVNMTGFAARPEHAWELREEFKQAQRRGKKVVIFFEDLSMTGFHLASVADVVVMDPLGMMMLPGLVMGRTFMKNTLDKLGLGFEELRFFSHKSAYENYSRDNFSAASREQYDAFLDDWYNLLRKDICSSRGFDEQKWQEIIGTGMFNGRQALELGLVDKLGRWSELDDILKQQTDRKLVKMPNPFLWDNAVLPEQWGALPQIALVYGVGVCDMETGIRARYLERVFNSLRENNAVKAVVFRVDSPGGSGMASDLVLQALKKCAEIKPVIVSQGQVAGSGGYWISVFGDKILAGPNTITGSVGVISGWVWDKGLSKKLGMTEDHVQRGEHADLLFGVTLPLLGITIPARNLTAEERATIETWIRSHYDDFVTRVAQGRGMTPARADSLGQGRFYSGVEGAANGLVDQIGGLMMAIDMAKKEGGINKDDDFELVEIPRSLGLFDLLSALPGVNAVQEDPVVRYLKMISKSPYRPLDLMPPGSYPLIEK